MKRFYRVSKIAAAILTLSGGLSATPAFSQVDTLSEQPSAGELTFTLITGDKVTAVVKADGELAGVRLVGEDGNEVVTSIYQYGNEIYVVPPKAQKLVDAKAIDMELFNINKLYQGGYDDKSTDKLPVIVEYVDGTLAGAATPQALAGMSLTGEIEIIDSAAFGIEKAQAAELWSKLTTDSSVEGVWLDAMVHAHEVSASAALTPTVPLTGAHGEFAANFDGDGVTVAVLDTGYDVEHLDLAGQVIASKDFTYSRNGVDDLNGHGTHTASTVAGTGEISGGLWAGMAPGADLVIGKVLGNTGGGSTYGILNGMLWAVDQGADIVSMSLGGSATSCDGPMVDMVEALSDKALFVISAGNSFTRETVGSPGCAPSALTVAAIDRDNETAVFSSRGPSPDGHSPKPDIASQGVDVVAAASGGSGDTGYTALSGTSMSAPHVSGGAAILKQARPELSPRELKKVLTSSVTPNDSHVLEQGAGPMDVNEAIVQAVVGAPNIELGFFGAGQEYEFTETSVTLENLSAEDKTFKLKLDLIGEDGSTQVPATLAGLGIKSITVPAHGSAEVPLWIDPLVGLNSGAYGAITGRIEGTTTGNNDERITVSVSFWIDQPSVELNFSVTDHRGKPATSPSKIYLMNDEDDWGRYVSVNNGEASVTVPEGEYSIVANIMTYDNDSAYGGLVESAAQMAVLRRKVASDSHIEFDARNAEKVEFKADQPLAPQGYSFGFTYALDDAKFAKLAAIELAPDYVNNFYAWSQGHDDRFRSFVTTRALAPETVMTMENGEVLEYVNQGEALSFHGEGSAEIVPVGDAGYSTDWSQFDLEGKVALISNPYYLTSYMVGNAMQQGAIGVIAYRPGTHGRYKGLISGTPRIPVVALSADQGARLHAEVEAGNNLVSWSGIAAERSPYAYSINHITDGHIDGGLVRIHDEQMYKITAKYHTQNDGHPAWTDMMAMTNSTGEFYSTGSPQMVMTPVERDEFYTATSKNAWTNIVMPSSRLNSNGGYFDGPRLMTPGAGEQTSWFKGPRGGTLLSNGSAIAYRNTNVVQFSIPVFGDANGHDGTGGYNTVGAYGITVNGQSQYLDSGMLTVGNGSDEIKLEIRSYPRGVGERSPIKDELGSFYQGIYTFTTNASQQGAQPVLVPVLDTPVAIDNTAPAGEPMAIKLAGLMDGIGEVDLASVSLQYGYGQECALENVSAYIYCPVNDKFSANDWVDAEIKQIEGEWVAIVPNAAAAGEFVHLRVEMSSNSGSHTEQTTMRVYKLK
ncbi:S8 family serine peptidase [uncultured Microbulbifer sp.]|uniref:S8 family serine peptidase n=1 Tax=uncultured Microbulbifer sp. TaxID=348147 RepID=UPI0025E64F1A|nr:S8 family serine peptidase [uncultured Microbulbifer sp.]